MMSNNPFRSTQRDEGYVSEGYEGANEEGTAGIAKEMDVGRDEGTSGDGGEGPISVGYAGSVHRMVKIGQVWFWPRDPTPQDR